MSAPDSWASSLAMVVVVVVDVLVLVLVVAVTDVVVAEVVVALLVVEVVVVAEVLLTVVVEEDVHPPLNDFEDPSHAAHCWSASVLAATAMNSPGLHCVKGVHSRSSFSV
jgi:hypothetical protein